MITARQSYGLLVVFFAALWVAAPVSAIPASLGYSVRRINHTAVHVIKVDLTDQSLMITPQLANDTLGQRQSFHSFLANHHPLAQITGSYFSLRSGLPIGDIVIGGHVRCFGPVGSALTIMADNTAEIVNIPPGRHHSWAGCENVLKGGLRLLQHGRYAVFPHDQGFHDPCLFRRATRTAVGLTWRHKLLLVAVGDEIYLSELAAIMKHLGCCDAMTLDGGNSTGLAFGNNVILSPGRALPSVLMVLPPQYAGIKAAPANRMKSPLYNPFAKHVTVRAAISAPRKPACTFRTLRRQLTLDRWVHPTLPGYVDSYPYSQTGEAGDQVKENSTVFYKQYCLLPVSTG